MGPPPSPPHMPGFASAHPLHVMGGSHHAGGSVLSYIKVEDGARHCDNRHAHVMLWWKYKSTIFLLQVI